MEDKENKQPRVKGRHNGGAQTPPQAYMQTQYIPAYYYDQMNGPSFVYPYPVPTYIVQTNAQTTNTQQHQQHHHQQQQQRGRSYSVSSTTSSTYSNESNSPKIKLLLPKIIDSSLKHNRSLTAFDPTIEEHETAAQSTSVLFFSIHPKTRAVSILMDAQPYIETSTTNCKLEKQLDESNQMDETVEKNKTNQMDEVDEMDKTNQYENSEQHENTQQDENAQKLENTQKHEISQQDEKTTEHNLSNMKTKNQQNKNSNKQQNKKESTKSTKRKKTKIHHRLDSFRIKMKDEYVDTIEGAAQVMKDPSLATFFEKSGDSKRKIIHLLKQTGDDDGSIYGIGSHLHNQRYLHALFKAANVNEAAIALELIMRGPFRSRFIYRNTKKEVIYFVPLPYFSPHKKNWNTGPVWLELQTVIDAMTNFQKDLETNAKQPEPFVEEAQQRHPPIQVKGEINVTLSSMFQDPYIYHDLLSVLQFIQTANALSKPIDTTDSGKNSPEHSPNKYHQKIQSQSHGLQQQQ